MVLAAMRHVGCDHFKLVRGPGIISDATAIEWKLKPKDFSIMGEKACGLSVAELTTTFPAVPDSCAPLQRVTVPFHALLLSIGKVMWLILLAG